jgi:hypothetical protein
MRNLNIQSIPLDDPDIANTGHDTRIIERDESIRASCEMSTSQLLQKESLWGLNRPDTVTIDKRRDGSIRNPTERIGYRYRSGYRAIKANPLNHSVNNIARNTATGRIMYENTR